MMILGLGAHRTAGAARRVRTRSDPRARQIRYRRRQGARPAARPANGTDRKAAKVAELSDEGLSLRLIGRQVGLSKNTVGAILKRRAPAT
jgi:putative DNA-invertase from lambdoid prophage Rac